jgi:CRISPR type III-A-associated protein Csm2
MKKIDPQWVKVALNQEAIDWAEQAAKIMTQNEQKNLNLSSSQLRRFYTALKMIQADYLKKRELIPLLKPKLAYNAARTKRNESAAMLFYHANSNVLSELNSLGELEFFRYASIMEAVVAFHKLYDNN